MKWNYLDVCELFIFCASILALICSIVITNIRNANQDPNDKFQKRVQKVTYEGHEYLIYNIGVCHYPECKCLKEFNNEC
jgi:hypothetical protein